MTRTGGGSKLNIKSGSREHGGREQGARGEGAGSKGGGSMEQGSPLSPPPPPENCLQICAISLQTNFRRHRFMSINILASKCVSSYSGTLELH